MPSNYIPWGGLDPKRKQLRFASAREKISGIAQVIKGREEGPVEKGPLWQRILFTFLYKLSFPQIPKMDRKFWVDEKCSHTFSAAGYALPKILPFKGENPLGTSGANSVLPACNGVLKKPFNMGKKRLNMKDIIIRKSN